jgi:hypothetical protein
MTHRGEPIARRSATSLLGVPGEAVHIGSSLDDGAQRVRALPTTAIRAALAT